jgi:hypothetical protein
LSCHCQIARDDDLKKQIGKDIFFDLVDHDKVQSFRIQKQTSFIQFKVNQGSTFFPLLFNPKNKIVAGRGGQRTRSPCSVSTFLALGQTPKSNMPSKQAFDRT